MDSTEYIMECGCHFPVIGPPRKPGQMPRLSVDIESVSLCCAATWELISSGQTKGVFQVESSLGRHWSKEIKPVCIDDLAAIGALMRPGCLKAKSPGKDGKMKSMTQFYADRKNGLEENTVYHEALREVFKPTYGVLVYQEQAMRICMEIANFDPQEADMLRKAIGKKLPEEMAKVKKMYLEKVRAANIVNEAQGIEIFEWIEKSQRYSFNRSHAVSYGYLGYWSAFVKAHFPVEFYCKWLEFAKDKIDPQLEVKELVSDSKMFNVEILPPDFRDLRPDVFTDHDKVWFGMTSVRGIGNAIVDKVNATAQTLTDELGPVSDWSWYTFLTRFSSKVSSTAVKHLIMVGALRYMDVPRQRMLYEYEKWSELTVKEQDWIVARGSELANLYDGMVAAQPTKKFGGGTANVNRSAIVLDLLRLLENPPYSLEDTTDRIAYDEEHLIGVALTVDGLDACDTRQANCSCREFLEGRDGYLMLAVEIERVNEYKTKGGQNPGQKMAFLTVKDSTCSIDDCVVFTEELKTYGAVLVVKNTALIQVERDKKRGSMVIKKAWSI